MSPDPVAAEELARNAPLTGRVRAMPILLACRSTTSQMPARFGTPALGRRQRGSHLEPSRSFLRRALRCHGRWPPFPLAPKSTSTVLPESTMFLCWMQIQCAADPIAKVG